MKKILPICCCIIMLLLGGCQSQEPQEEAFIRDHAFSEEEESLLMTLPFDSEDRLLTYAVFDYSIPKTYHTVGDTYDPNLTKFNLADMAITGGVLVLLLSMILKKKERR